MLFRSATNLLMPEPAVRAVWAEAAVPGGDPAVALASRFDVSPLAMAWRLYNLGLVPDQPPPYAG